ncbi:MAG: hypothetical protein ABFD91_18210, partial [Anaerohalosphaeraceae bacterium]
QTGPEVARMWADVYAQDGQAWAYGALKQQAFHSNPIKTHVDIQILSEDGSVQYETISEDTYVPRSRVGKGADWKRFRVKLAGDITPGSKVIMKVHSGQHCSSVDKDA